uniref:C-type lectin domain-containing protein n=1 Tax=Neolamprologus brichardi TaxID=32507 RepID=A0A3Q4N9Q8_NEOBR
VQCFLFVIFSFTSLVLSLCSLLSAVSPCDSTSLDHYLCVFSLRRKTWTEAQSYCREHFTDLVTIYNSNINQLLFSMSPRIHDWAWTGLYNDRYSWKWSMEGNLFDVGSTHEFLIWANSQPDCAYAKEYCVALQGQTQMNDRPCGDSYPFLCPECKHCKILSSCKTLMFVVLYVVHF